jgi:hypothetical protein
MDLTDLTDQHRWELYSSGLDSDNAAIRATVPLCLIHQASFWGAHQIAAMEQQCIGEGSYSDRSITRDLPVYC